MNAKLVLAGIAATAVVAFSLLCTNPTHSGNGSGVGNAAVAGVVYNADGTPAKNATVHIRKKSTLADTSGVLKKVMEDSATVTTDDSGKFAIDSIDTGTYVIEGSDGGNNLAMNDSVVVESADSSVVVPPDTLKPAGAIKGVIKLSEGGDPRKVFVLAFGIDRFARVNVDGSFKFEKLAEGPYDLRLISSLDNYGVLDTVGVAVKSADTTDLGTIELPFTGIPTPKNVTISYDTLKQIVTLSWSKADTALVKSYNVYRRNVDSNTVLTRINASPIADTLYRDSTGVQDQSYEYAVAAVDKNATEGTKSAGVSAKVMSAFSLIKSFQLGTDEPFRFVVSRDSLIYVAYRTQGFVGVFNLKGDSIRTFGKGMFQQLYDIAMDSKGITYAADPQGNRIVKFSPDGDSLHEWSVNDPTVVAINGQDEVYIGYSNETRVLKCDTLGTVTDSLSSIKGTKQIPLVGKDGYLYIIDSDGLTVTKCDASGNPLTIFSVPDQLASYLLLDVDVDGNIYLKKSITVGQSAMYEVHVYNPTGKILSTFGRFSFLNDLVINGSILYLTDFNNDPWYPNMQIFTTPF